MATGTGKTSSRFRSAGSSGLRLEPGWRAPRQPRILFLADRNILVDDPKDKISRRSGMPAGRSRAASRAEEPRDVLRASTSRSPRTSDAPGLYREYPPDFFDLIIVDECHRGSARDESHWREILELLRASLSSSA